MMRSGLFWLRDVALLWVINVATFAIWYWGMDGSARSPRPRAWPRA